VLRRQRMFMVRSVVLVPMMTASGVKNALSLEYTRGSVTTEKEAERGITPLARCVRRGGAIYGKAERVAVK